LIRKFFIGITVSLTRMGFELIITEKPKQAQKIAYALADGKPKAIRVGSATAYEAIHDGKKLVVAPAVGHLFGLKEKEKGWDYPVFDIEWVPTFEYDKKAFFSKKYFTLLTSLVKGATEFTVSCDYDIEGELIGYNVLRFIFKQKNAARMKFSTLTKLDLIEAYKNKQKKINMGQAIAGETRHMLDWYYGINVSRALTTALKHFGTFRILSSGRVQGPALKILVDREREIIAFKPKTFWKIRYDGELNKTGISAFHETDKFWDEKDAKDVIKKCKGKDGFIEKFDEKIYEQYPPVPFDLTTLQLEAHRWFRMTPQTTLKHAQSLYLGGAISYPRTSSQKLPPQIGWKRLLTALSKNAKYTKLAKSVLKKEKLYPRQGKKEDPAHPAIYPTGHAPKEVNPQTAKLYDLIVKRFLAAFGDPAKREHVKITINVEKELFIAEGHLTLEKGWHKLYSPYVKFNEVSLPKAELNDPVKYRDIEKSEDETKPPRRYTQASLVHELAERNLGTKATRGSIVETLFKRGYVTGGPITATKLGLEIITILEKRVPDIIDEELTRSFEEEMEEIRGGELKEGEVLTRAEAILKKTLGSFKRNEKLIGEELNKANIAANHEASLGICPVCKKGYLIIRHSKAHKRFLACDQYPKCETTFPIPQIGKLYKTEDTCQICGYPIINVFNPGIRRTIRQCINPECKSNKSENEGKKCPKCKKGTMAVRTSRYGIFLACDQYPTCKYIEKIEHNLNTSSNKSTK